ncbi:MAG: M16 family metallopeptidase [Caldicoprobacterales bacterium]|jgi:predicted Zn-dependent peptidase|nr:insulinase family protein [Clostridiales bacterium]
MYKKFQLDNGIRIIYERIPQFKSVSIGFWFQAGSSYEKPEENGLSHFIEHMLFKGTKKRNAKQIAEEMDSVGGQLNAFTAKEFTCLYCKIIDEHLELGLDLLSDMVLNSMFDDSELEKERGVILEEIAMYEDSPEDSVHELLAEAFFGKHSLAKPILGSTDQLLKYKRADLVNFYNQYYTTDNFVIAVAGNFQEEQLIPLIKSRFEDWNKRGSVPSVVKEIHAESRILFKRKEIEQLHVSLSFPGLEAGNDDIYPLLVMNNMFGGSMSSRLFQKVREERGLAYSIYSYPSSYIPGGMFNIYASMKPNQSEIVLKLIMEEVEMLKKKGFTDEEFHMAREQLKGNYILNNESTGSRMNSIGKARLMKEEIMTPSEVVSKINSIRPNDVERVIKNIFQKEHVCAALVGSEDLSEKLWNIIKCT